MSPVLLPPVLVTFPILTATATLRNNYRDQSLPPREVVRFGVHDRLFNCIPIIFCVYCPLTFVRGVQQAHKGHVVCERLVEQREAAKENPDDF